MRVEVEHEQSRLENVRKLANEIEKYFPETKLKKIENQRTEVDIELELASQLRAESKNIVYEANAIATEMIQSSQKEARGKIDEVEAKSKNLNSEERKLRAREKKVETEREEWIAIRGELEIDLSLAQEKQAEFQEDVEELEKKNKTLSKKLTEKKN